MFSLPLNWLFPFSQAIAMYNKFLVSKETVVLH